MGWFPFSVVLQLVLIVFVTLGYILSSLDLIPEAALGIVGLADDVLVVVGIALHFAMVLRHSVLNGHNTRAS